MVTKMNKLMFSGYIFVALSSLGFSVKSVLAKLAYTYGTDAETLVVMRILLSIPFFLIALAVIEGKEGFKIEKNDLPHYLSMGLLGVGLPILFAFYSIELIDASLAALVVYAYPAITIILLQVFCGEKAGIGKYFSIAVTFVGLVFVLKAWNTTASGIDLKGVGYGLLAAFFYSVYNILNERKIKKISPIKVVTMCMISAAIIFGLSIGIRPYPESIEVWLIALTLAFASTFVPFVCYGYSIKHIGASKTALVSSIGPIFTVIWAYIILGETLDGLQFFGMALIICGIGALKSKVKEKTAEDLPLR